MRKGRILIAIAILAVCLAAPAHGLDCYRCTAGACNFAQIGESGTFTCSEPCQPKPYDCMPYAPSPPSITYSPSPEPLAACSPIDEADGARDEALQPLIVFRAAARMYRAPTL
jgi:hypothetical protein